MCDEVGNRVLLFDAMVRHRRCLTANTHSDQKFVEIMVRYNTSVP